jgi:succinate-semialdehyde dehydrogenase/glutarate-semialdehyde dehydrogenase
VKKVEEHIADALKRGAKVVTGGNRHKLGGNFFEPTVLANVPRRRADLPRGNLRPGRAAVPLQDRGRGDPLANDTEFGLAAYFYAPRRRPHLPRGEALEYGIVGINEGIISTAEAPFGGVKQSGLGREGSKYGIEDYLEIKYLAATLGRLGRCADR